MRAEPRSIWAPDADDDLVTPAGGSPDRDAGAGTMLEVLDPPDDELVQLFGDPTAIRPLGEVAIAHRRRGIAAADGGGETLDRRRRGSSDDVLVTLLAHPTVAATQAIEGTAFGASRRLRVDVTTRRPERRDLVFDASLRTMPWARRSARLRLYGSASRNVTVLTLTPARRRRRPSRWFVRSGNRAMERVVEQLAADIEPWRWQPPADR